MNKKYNYLTKNVFLFTISTFGPKILSFLMVRVYTGTLTRAEYGIAELITTTCNLLIPLLTVCVDSGVLRFSIDGENKKEKVFTNTLFMLGRGILISLIGTIALAFVLHGRIENFRSLYFFYFLCFFVANSSYHFLSCYCRGIDRVGVMVEMSLITTGASCVMNILFLIVFKWGIDGYMIANFGGTYIAILWGAFRVRAIRDIKPKTYDKKFVREIEKYSFPLIFNQIGWWLNNSVDKYVVTAFLGVESNGVYSVSYKIPTILTTISGVFANAWSLSAIKEFDPDDKDGFVAKMYNLYNGVLCIACAVILLLNIPIARVLYAKDFFHAWQFTGPLMIAVIFGAFSGFIGAIFSAVKDTKVYSISTIIGGVVNIGLSVLLVNFIGIMGVAIGTLVANVVIWAFRLIKSRKYIKIRIPLIQHIIMYVLLVAEFLLGLQGWGVLPLVEQGIIVLVIIIMNRHEFVRMIKTGKKMITGKFKKRKVKSNDSGE